LQAPLLLILFLVGYRLSS